MSSEEMPQKTGISNVPGDVHYLLLSELGESAPSALRSVSQTSKAMHKAASQLLYRELKLYKPMEGAQGSLGYQALINRIRDSEADDITGSIRTITVQNEVPSEDLLLILDKIAKFGELRKLNWNTSTHMPEAVLEKLQSTWPELELCVAVTNRENVVNNTIRPLDWKLLSSKLLTRLQYIVHVRGQQYGEPCRSEWTQLSQNVLPRSRLRHLEVRTKYDGDAQFGHAVQDTEVPKLAGLDLSLNPDFSRLEQLTIRERAYSKYVWDEDHCKKLLSLINPSRLRGLDFGDQYPESLFATFAGHVPNLKSLRFGIKSSSNLEPVREFISSLSSLESLHVGHAQRGIDELWPAIEGHGKSLETLILGPTWDDSYPEYLEMDLLKTIATSFPKLQRLGWHVASEHLDKKDFLALLSSMKLRKLDLYMHIPDDATEWSDELEVDVMSGSNVPPLKREESIAAAKRIAEAISPDQTRPLEWLTLYISRTLYYDRYQPYSMRTAFQMRGGEGETAKDREYEVRGKMLWWSGKQSMEEELLFEEDS